MMKITIGLLIAALLLTGTALTAEHLTTGGAQSTAATANGAGRLSAEEAKAIALEHAGLTADQITGLRAEYEVDDGIPEWEIDFRSGDYEYDYTVHAETGALRKADKEYDPVKSASSPAAAEPATQATGTLSAEEAKAIALEHAGLTADQVTGLRAEFDRDDGRYKWDVDFRSGGYEYDYTIHAETGKILDFDKDRDD